jgi:hypothetical protein
VDGRKVFKEKEERYGKHLHETCMIHSARKVFDRGMESGGKSTSFPDFLLNFRRNFEKKKKFPIRELNPCLGSESALS